MPEEKSLEDLRVEAMKALIEAVKTTVQDRDSGRTLTYANAYAVLRSGVAQGATAASK